EPAHGDGGDARRQAVEPVEEVHRVAPADDEDGDDDRAEDVDERVGQAEAEECQDVADEGLAEVFTGDSGGGEELAADLHPRADAIDVIEEPGEGDDGGADDDADG